MEPDVRARLKDFRHGLLRLHKTLLDWERSTYEQTHGRQSSADLLNALLNDLHFAWLRPMSQLIVRIDELLEEETAADADVAAALANVRDLTSSLQSGNGRYQMALQASPDAVFAHRDLVALLGRER